MKKRIISLILVVAMAFLTLTGCAYNYAKDDMSKYATLNIEEFYSALQALNFTDADFGTDETERQVKVQDAIAQAILKVTDTADKKYAGTLNKYDALYFAYYAVDADSLKPDNAFFAGKMNETTLTNVQLGLSNLEGLNKAISDKILELGIDIKDYIYSTSSASVVGDKDVVSVSYTKLDKDGKELAKVSNEYFVVSTGEASANKEFAKVLIGKTVGVTLDEFKVTETVGEAKEPVEYTYKDVKVESIVKDNSVQNVEDGDIVNVTYTVKFDAKPWYNEETGKFEFKDELNYLASNVNAEQKYTVTFTNTFVTAKADPTIPEGATDEEKAAAEAAKTFAGQLVGKFIGSTSTFNLKEEHDGKLVDVEYSGVKVNWIVNSGMNPIEVKYTPYEKNEDGTTANGKTNIEIAVNGEKVVLDGEELTYRIFPVYFLDVEDLSAELIVREFYSAITETKAHDEAEEGEHEEGEEHEHEKLFSVLTKNFKNGDKTLEALVGELSTLYSTLSSKESSLTSALNSLKTAQTNYAKITETTSDSEKTSLKTKLDTANTSYKTAKDAVDKAQADVDAKIKEILGCKDGETSVEAGLVEDYKNYQYYNLETEYKNAIDKSVVTEIIGYLNKNVKFEQTLPKKAVKEAYKSIMNSHKYNFYEGYYTDSSSSSSSANKVTNYAKYNGDFDAYLMAVTKTSDMKAAKAAVQKAAEESVKDVIIIYVLTNAVEAKWDTELSITKEEKKNIKKNIEAQEAAWQSYASLYEMYGMAYSSVVPSYSDAYHSSQFDKVINYLIEKDAADGNKIVYKHINYNAGAVEK